MADPLLLLALRATSGLDAGKRLVVLAVPASSAGLLDNLKLARPDLDWSTRLDEGPPAMVLVVASGQALREGGLPAVKDGHQLVVLCPELTARAAKQLLDAPYGQRLAPVLLHSPEAVLERRTEGLVVHALVDGLSAVALQTRLATPLLAPPTLGALPPLTQERAG